MPKIIYKYLSRKCQSKSVLIHQTQRKNVIGISLQIKDLFLAFVGNFCKVTLYGQVSTWQSATLLPISCKSAQPVTARVDKPVSLVRQSSSGGARTIHPFPRCLKPIVGCQSWHNRASGNSAAGGEHDRQGHISIWK